MKIHHFKKLDSTNKKARQFDPGNVIISEIQTKGKGRFKRTWSSGKGGIWLSIVLKPKTKNPLQLTFLTAVAVQKAIKKTLKIDTDIKWPNDLLYNKKKVCGILTESIFKNQLEKMIVGIGLNVNNKVSTTLRKKAISLKTITKKEINLIKLTNTLIKEFNTTHKTYQKKGFLPILRQWKAHCSMFGKTLKVKTIKSTYAGKPIAIDKNCNLILKLKDGSKKTIVEGDVVV